MYPTFLKEAQVVRQVLKDLPSLVITMPFQPRIQSPRLLERYARKVFSKAKSALCSDPYTGDPAPVIRKLHSQFAALDYQSTKKSIALFVTGSIDKIFYVDMPLEENLCINGSFYMRDLVHQKRKVKDYLVLAINKSCANTYAGNEDKLRLLKTDSSSHLFDYSTGRSEVQKSNFKPSGETETDFLNMLALQFSWVTDQFPCPVFIMGNKKQVSAVFENIKNRKNVVQLIHRSIDISDTRRISAHLKPFLQDWDTVWQTYLMQQMEEARADRKLISGLNSVCDAMKKPTRGLLLIDEQMYVPFKHDNTEEGTAPFYINDKIDKVIETAISQGVDIEMVKPELVEDDYGIAFIRKTISYNAPDQREQKDQSWTEIF